MRFNITWTFPQRMSLIPVPIIQRLRSYTSRTPSRSPTPDLDRNDLNLPATNSNSIAQPLSVPPINLAVMNYQALKIESVDRLTSTGANYNAWCAIQNIIMDARGVLNVVNGTEKAPAEALPLIEWKSKDKFAKAQIAQNIELSLLNDMNHDTSHDLWIALQKRFSSLDEMTKRKLSLMQTSQEETCRWGVTQRPPHQTSWLQK